MSTKGQLTLVSEPLGFFQELVSHALESQRVQVKAETEIYLSNLLMQFMNTDKLYYRDGKGNLEEKPLALMIKDAMEESVREHQSSLFRYVGDFSLYVAGFFQESLGRKLVDVDYYIGMGGTAYKQVAVRTDSLKDVYLELSDKFPRFVDVLGEVSEKTTAAPTTEKDLLKLYDIWVNTGSGRAAKALRKAGIEPSTTSAHNPTSTGRKRVQ